MNWEQQIRSVCQRSIQDTITTRLEGQQGNRGCGWIHIYGTESAKLLTEFTNKNKENNHDFWDSSTLQNSDRCFISFLLLHNKSLPI